MNNEFDRNQVPLEPGVRIKKSFGWTGPHTTAIRRNKTLVELSVQYQAEGNLLWIWL